MPNPKHNLYTNADADRPAAICDRNGDVVLAQCKDCGRGEVELSAPCETAMGDMALRWASEWAETHGCPAPASLIASLTAIAYGFVSTSPGLFRESPNPCCEVPAPELSPLRGVKVEHVPSDDTEGGAL